MPFEFLFTLPYCPDFRKLNLPLFANALARLCHTVGKTLPTVWQKLANTVAKSWQSIGKMPARHSPFLFIDSSAARTTAFLL